MPAKKSKESKGLTTTTKRRPLENFFNLPEVVEDEDKEVATEQPVQNTPTASAVDAYDEKDDDIEAAYSKIHNDAIVVHQTIIDDIEDIEGSKRARMYEVAANYLNIGLSAIHERAKMKEHKDKLTAKTTSGGGNVTKTVNQTLIMNTRDAIKDILKSNNVVEGEVIEITDESGKIVDE
jgi:hypothetical protein